MGTPFTDATTVEARGDGRYRATVDERWNLRPLPQGGIVVATGLRAMAQELNHRDQRLRTLHTIFVGQVAHGELDIDVDVLRRGRSMSHLRAEVRNPGTSNGHVVTAVFGGERGGFRFTDLRPPDVPPPDECRSFRDPPPPGVPAFPPTPFWELLVEGRPALGLAPWDEAERATSEQATWLGFDEPAWLDDGTIDPLSLVVVADTMPGAVSQRVGPSNRMWFAPSVDLTVHLLDECRSPWVLAHNTARYAGDGYASVDVALWDMGDGPRLVAYATQLCFFTFFDGP